jgi:hypothetical protein
VDPIPIVLAGLALAAAAAVQQLAGSTVSDAYGAFKEILRRRLAGRRLTSARCATGGDYATVFEAFARAPAALRPLIKAPEFEALIEERTRTFIGRGHVLAAIDRELADSAGGSGYIIVCGEPGIGKTALAAQLVKTGGHVHHFNVVTQNIRSARQFLQNACAQLIVRYDLGFESLPPDAVVDSGFLVRLLTEAAAQAEATAALPVVVVVDALDEAEDGSLAPGANRLHLPAVLPRGVFFVVTTRDEHDRRLDVERETTIWIREEDPGNSADIVRYVEAFIAEHEGVMKQRMAAWGVAKGDLVAQLVERSEGNFMYLVHVLADIAQGRLDADASRDLHALPHGLQGYYRRHWRHMRAAAPERFEQRQRPVLSVLAVSREPVGLSQLCEWTGLPAGHVRAVLDEWQEFLNEVDRPAGGRAYRLYHRSFGEFLEAEASLRAYHERIAETALAKLTDR